MEGRYLDYCLRCRCLATSVSSFGCVGIEGSYVSCVDLVAQLLKALFHSLVCVVLFPGGTEAPGVPGCFGDAATAGR